jgi:hypothetical protein
MLRCGLVSRIEEVNMNKLHTVIGMLAALLSAPATLGESDVEEITVAAATIATAREIRLSQAEPAAEMSKSGLLQAETGHMRQQLTQLIDQQVSASLKKRQ